MISIVKKNPTIFISIVGLVLFIAGIIPESIDNRILDTTDLKISPISGKIHIVGNAGWVDFRNAGNCTGSGNYTHPYVIEDLIIDAGGSGSCILIENSDVYFRIENCTVYNSGEAQYPDYDAGIKLSSVRYGTLINNNASNNWYGIYLSSGDHNNISGNIVNYNDAGIYDGYGIYLYVCDNNMIKENTANNNDVGIYLIGSDNNTISGNIVNSNNENGIKLGGGRNNIISGNTVINHNYNGIALEGYSTGTMVSGNLVNNNSNGIYLLEGNNINIRSNVITNNSVGIYIAAPIVAEGRSYEISNNTFSGNGVDIYTHPKFSPPFNNTIIVIPIIVALAFLGMLFITRTRATKEADIESRKIFRITSVINSIICLVGGILVIITAVEERVGYFGIGTITVGIFIIIGALIGLKFQRSGFLLCLSMGVIAVLPRICDEVWEWSVTAPCIMVFMTYQLGVAFSIGGGIVGLIGGILKSREDR